CQQLGVEHIEIRMDMPASVIKNPPDRCYLCKKEVMRVIAGIAVKKGFENIFDGTNADDLHEHRPGILALIETGVRSPLADTGFTKDEIRELSREVGLEVSDRPSNSCLLTRFPHGALITDIELRKAEEAENYIALLGFTGSRVRVHGDLVRIEWRKEHLDAMMHEETRRKITAALKVMGYRYITIDTEGYRSGSMDNK
ncbi:MAG: ATP-dependent sacrificial sulfur transferase LarE, partial [bacterium]